MPSSSCVLVIDPPGPEVDDLRHLLAAAGHETIHAPGLDDAVGRFAEADAVLLGAHAHCLAAISAAAAMPVAPPGKSVV